jgi:hypothetical protein
MQTKDELRDHAARLNVLYERAFRRWNRRMRVCGVYSDLAFEALHLMTRISHREHATKELLRELEKLGPYYR